MRDHNYWVYILANATHSVLYVGMTNNLEYRVGQHAAGEGGFFTRKYKVNKLIYYEHTTSVDSAIRREKQLKHWRREKKLKLIQEMNPSWNDLAADWHA